MLLVVRFYVVCLFLCCSFVPIFLACSYVTNLFLCCLFVPMLLVCSYVACFFPCCLFVPMLLVFVIDVSYVFLCKLVTFCVSGADPVAVSYIVTMFLLL